MTHTDYALPEVARQRRAERRTRSAEAARVPRPPRRHALAQRFRQIADAIDT